MVTRYRSTSTYRTKRERLLVTVNELAREEPSRYFSIAEIGKRAGLLPKETQAWLAILRLNERVDAVMQNGVYWYAPK